LTQLALNFLNGLRTKIKKKKEEILLSLIKLISAVMCMVWQLPLMTTAKINMKERKTEKCTSQGHKSAIWFLTVATSQA
jgi:hypothetical protein